jgi:hypothetical protein
LVGFRVRVSAMVKVDETLLCLPCQLYDYVGSSNFTDVCGAQTSATLFHWLGNSFFANSHLLLFYFRKHLRHFDEYVNSIVEQQHAAVKITSTGTLWCLKFDVILTRNAICLFLPCIKVLRQHMRLIPAYGVWISNRRYVYTHGTILRRTLHLSFDTYILTGEGKV